MRRLKVGWTWTWRQTARWPEAAEGQQWNKHALKQAAQTHVMQSGLLSMAVQTVHWQPHDVWSTSGPKVNKPFFFFHLCKKVKIFVSASTQWKLIYDFLCSNGNAPGGGLGWQTKKSNCSAKKTALYFNRLFILFSRHKVLPGLALENRWLQPCSRRLNSIFFLQILYFHTLNSLNLLMKIERLNHFICKCETKKMEMGRSQPKEQE